MVTSSSTGNINNTNSMREIRQRQYRMGFSMSHQEKYEQGKCYFATIKLAAKMTALQK